MSLSWKIYSLMVGAGLFGVILILLTDCRSLVERLMAVEDRIDLLERDKHTLYRKLNEVRDVKQGGVENKPAEKARDQMTRNSDNQSVPLTPFNYTTTILSDGNTQSGSSSGGYSSSDSGSSSSSSSFDSSSF